MLNTKFEAYKIKREIKRSGVEYEFKRQSLNDFNEQVGEPSTVCKLKGIFHEVLFPGGKADLLSQDASQTRSKKSQMVLCLYEDAACLRMGDLVSFNNKTFKIITVSNIQEWSIVADIFLEVVDYGI